MRAVNPAYKCVSFQATSGLPYRGGKISLKVRGSVLTVALLVSYYDPILHIGPEPTVVGIIGCTYEGERRIIRILIPVNFLPRARGIEIQRIFDANGF